jgi:hypothetical protein
MMAATPSRPASVLEQETSPEIRPRLKAVHFFLVGLGLCLTRVPFFRTHFIQDDALISLRCAVQLADTGIYGFNPGVRTSASTSHLYVFLAALIRRVAGESYLPIVLAVNTVLLIIGLLLITRALIRRRETLLGAWILLALTPVAIVISQTGMETSLLVFLLGIVLAELRDRDVPSWRGLTGLALLPWVRPDAVVICAIVAFSLWFRMRRGAVVAAVASAIGTLGLLAFNLFYFGQVLNQTIVAKEVVFHPSHAPLAILRRLIARYFTWGHETGAYVPLQARYAVRLGALCACVVFVVVGVRLKRWRANPGREVPALSLSLIAVVLPAAYAVGGVFFPWYTWPSNLCATALVIVTIMEWVGHQPRQRAFAWAAGVGMLCCGGVAAQWAVSTHEGDLDDRFLHAVGDYLKGASHPGDSLFLEPAGHIPYYSGLRTDDLLGLVSPAITDYRRRFGPEWFSRYVRAEQPDFIVQHSPFEARVLDDPGGRASFGEEDLLWLSSHYVLLKTFSEETVTAPGALERRLAWLGLSPPYFVYRRR